MKRIIICCCGAAYRGRRDEIKRLEQSGEIQIVGVTDKKLLPGGTFDGWPVIPREKIGEYSFDSIVVFSYYAEKEIREELIGQGIDSQAIAFDLPFKKVESSADGVSILCNNCWGGICAHSLGIEFCSPTKNLWIPEHRFIPFLGHLRYYLSLDPVMVEWVDAMSCFDKPRVPKLMVGDIPLYCNHDTDPEEAIEKWQSRKKKVNYENIVAVFITETPKWETLFYQIEGIDKKYCLVPWESRNPHTVQIPKIEGCTWAETAIFTGKYGRGLDLAAMLRGSDDIVLEEQLYGDPR